MTPPNPPLSPRELFQIGRRRKLALLLPALAGAALAWLVQAQMAPRYVSEASIVLNLRTTKVIEAPSVMSALPLDTATLRTEMDVIRSRLIAGRVASKLGLADHPEFLEQHAAETPLTTLLEEVKTATAVWLGGSAVADPASPAIDAANATTMSEEDRRQELVDLLAEGVSVNNDGQSYTLHVRFASASPEWTATIVNAFADEYLEYQRDVKAEATREATTWLSRRLGTLRQQLESADHSVQLFRQEAGLFDATQATLARQRLHEFTAELTQLEREELKVDARLRTAHALSRAGGLRSYPEILHSPLIATLAQQQMTLQNRRMELLQTLGSNHPALLEIEAQLESLGVELQEQVASVVRSIEHERDIIQVRKTDLLAAIADAERQVAASTEAEVRLHQLEREADADRALYESLLSRLKQLAEQEEFQEADAWIISEGQVPWLPYYPRTLPIVLLGTIGGGLASLLLVLLREHLDQRLRSITDLESLTGLPVLGCVPSVRARRSKVEDYILRHPSSAYAEAIRATSMAIRFGSPRRSAQIISVTSALSGEGKTTFCIAMARALAAEGHRVLVIDADLRRPLVGKLLGDTTGGQLLRLLKGELSLSQATSLDQKSRAHYLGAPCVAANPMSLLASNSLDQALAAARACYDVVIIDTPPVTVASEAALVARKADASLLCVRYGQSAADQLHGALRLLALCGVQLVGIIFCRVNPRQQAIYAPRSTLPALFHGPERSVPSI
jgi:succinoglycan biosynthesis transport protein ExoP